MKLVKSKPDFCVNIYGKTSFEVPSPSIFGAKELPPADTTIPTKVVAPSLSVNCFSEKIIISPKHIIRNINGDVLDISFKKHHTHKHGGLKLIGENLYNFRSKTDSEEYFKLVNEPVYHADTEYPGVYGHDLLETISQLWAVKLFSGVKVYTSSPNTPYLRAMLNAIGFDLKDVIFGDCNILCTQGLIYPTPSVKLRRYIHEAAFDLFQNIKKRLVTSSALFPEKIYVSRSRMQQRALINECEVEAFFQSKGFCIIHPQDLDFETQVKYFSAAKFIAGAAGSAIHNTIFCESETRILLLTNPEWFVVADLLINKDKNKIGYAFGSPVNKISNQIQTNTRIKSDWFMPLQTIKHAYNNFFEKN